jgi:hypothetical protein
MALWRESYRASHCFLAQERARDADAAVAQFRQRYPAEPAAPPAVWYDEPPFAKDGRSHPCWVTGEEYPCATHWSHFALPAAWVYSTTENEKLVPINGRRVSPIVKPQEQPQ